MPCGGATSCNESLEVLCVRTDNGNTIDLTGNKTPSSSNLSPKTMIQTPAPFRKETEATFELEPMHGEPSYASPL